MKRTFTLIFATIALYSCSSSSSNGSNDTLAVDTTTMTIDTMTDAEKAAKGKAAPAVNATKWEYEEKEDKMTSKTVYYASITSDNELQFDFPYDGGSTGGITIRKGSNGNEVILTISKGQFHTDLDGTTIKVRFDKNKAITFNCSEASDNSSDVLFINNASKFIANAKKSQKMIVQAEFYESGLQNMEFTIGGLKWVH